MRLVATADLHIGSTHLCDEADQEAALDAVYEIVHERKADALLLAGDLTHHARPTPSTLRMLGSFFEKITSLGVDIIAVAGNHDPGIPGVVRYFRGRGRVHIADVAPGIVRCDGIDGIDVAVVPYLPDRFVRAQLSGGASREETAVALTTAAHDIVRGLLARRSPGVPMVFLGHGTVAGTETSSGYSMGFIGGTEWRYMVEDLAEFDFAAVGHIHKRQSPAPTIAVPGSLLPLDFSEDGPHGVVVADVAREKSTWEFVEIPTPKVATFDVVSAAAALHDVTVAQLVADATNYVDAGSLIRVRVTCDEPTAREYPPSLIERALLAAGARKVQVELTVEREDRARDAEMTSELLPLTALGRYVLGRTDLTDEQRQAVIAAGTIVVGDVAEKQRATGGGDVALDRIEIQDFLCHERAAIDFAGDRVQVLSGRNGIGKSSLGVDALLHTLFGASRAGARPDARLIRRGADSAMTAVELSLAGGRRIRVVRKLKRERGDRVASTLDVLEASGDGWRPLSTGKLVDGQAVLDELLGGLDLATLVASSVVVQRAADSFTRARPEERKGLLARAAGLAVYEQLGLHSAKWLNEADKDLDVLRGKAEQLRARAEAVEKVGAERATAERERDDAAAEVTRLEEEHTRATEVLEKAQERAAEHDRVQEDALRTQADIERVDGRVAEWAHKADVAREVLAEKDALLEARTKLAAATERLAGARAEIDHLQGELAAANTLARRRQESLLAIGRLERDFAAERASRERKCVSAEASLHATERQRDELRESGCLERCTHAPGCTVAAASAAAERRIVDLTAEAQAHATEGPREIDFRCQIVQLHGVLPEPPDIDGISAQIALARGAAQSHEREVADLTKRTAVAEKIAAAEQVLKEHDEQVAKLRAELAPLRQKRGELNARLLAMGSARGELERAQRDQDRVADELRAARLSGTAAGERVALLTGRLEELRAAAAELVALEDSIGQGARAVAAWKELIVAWRACRVAALENSLIPQIEQTANEVLRRFPHGLQIALRTQREKKSGDGLSETLDVLVIGRGETYEMCSGGEKTAIDFATHVALAVVVSRRATTRLHVLICDEPEGLDTVSRGAFAAVVRWLSEEFDLRCLCMSHAEDLVDQLGGTLVRVDEQMDEPEAVVA